MRLAGWLAVALVALIAGGAFVALGWSAVAGGEAFDVGAPRYVLGVTGFTLWQAALSTLLSLGGAVPLARALARRPAFPGRGAIVALLGLPLVIPALVAALAVIAVWGREGVLNDALAALGAERIGIYGLPGILIAHAFFNMPLAARLLLRHLAAVPAERWRLAAQLGLPAWTVWRLIEWPAIRPHVGGVALLVFALCVTSFAIVLILGAGPRSTTLEVAIYQSLRFDFLPGRAVALALVQLALTGLIALLLRGRAAEWGEGEGAPRRPAGGGHWTDGAIIAAAVLFVLGPLVALVVAGLRADLARLLSEGIVIDAILTSLALGGLAASAALVLTIMLVLGGHAGGARLRGAAGAVAALVLVVPPVVVGAGWFVALLGTGLAFTIAPVMIVAVNAMMALPFTVRVVGPAWARHARATDRLALSLGVSGAWRLWRLDLPAMRGALSLAFAFALALSLGDLGVVALFGSDEWRTLPLLLQQRMGSYRTADAAGLALILGALCLGIMALAQLAERGRAGGRR